MLVTDATRLHRLMNCNGSRLMAPSYPNSDDDPTARDEGNAAHAGAHEMFKGAYRQHLLNTAAFNGVLFTDEMFDAIEQYLGSLDCGEMEAVTTFRGAAWQVNARCDHRVYRDGVLTIDDFKYGHSPVEVEYNWTLLAHAMGTCIAWNIQPSIIILRIHQPRSYHPDGPLRAWSITYPQLLDYYAELDETLTNPSNELQTGEWCKRCHAFATCPAARMAGMNAIEAATHAFNDDIPSDVLAFELDGAKRALALIKARAEALEELAQHRLTQGEIVGDYHLGERWGHSAWLPGLTSAALTAASGIDCRKDDTINPAEAKRRGMPEHVIKALTKRPFLGKKLIRESADKRAKRALGK